MYAMLLWTIENLKPWYSHLVNLPITHVKKHSKNKTRIEKLNTNRRHTEIEKHKLKNTTKTKTHTITTNTYL